MKNRDLLAATVEFVQDDRNTIQVQERLVNVIRNMNRGKYFKKHFSELIANEIDLNLYESGVASLDTTYLWDGNIEVSKAFASDDVMYMYGCVQVFVNMTNSQPLVNKYTREDVIKAAPAVITFRESFQIRADLDDDGKPDLATLTVGF